MTTKNEREMIRKSRHCCVICALRKIIRIDIHIHHIDGNHQNDNSDNLIVLCQECHSFAHFSLKAKKSMTKKLTPGDLKHYRNLWLEKCETAENVRVMDEGKYVELSDKIDKIIKKMEDLDGGMK